jgi:thiol-disulfide isomerase/thioredoxin
MKKIAVFVYLLLSAFILPAQTQTTIYAGTIAGYRESMGFKTGQLIIYNLVTGQQEIHLINIKANGDFYVNFPLVRNQEGWLSFPFFHSQVYFEPGKKHMQDFKISDTWEVTSMFKGDGALINNDINKVRPILMDYNWDAIEADIYQLTPDQYKAYFLSIKAHKLKLIDSVAKATGMDETAYKLARLNVEYAIASSLMACNDRLESAYRKKNNISFENRTPVLVPLKLGPDYYDFLKSIKYNDPSALASYNYAEFMNRLKFIEPVYHEARIGGPDDEKELSLFKAQDTSKQEVKTMIKFYEDRILHQALPPGAREKAWPVVLKSLLNTDVSLELDLMYLQTVSQHMDTEKDTLSDATLAEVKTTIKHKFLLNDLSAFNNKLKQNINEAKIKTGYTYNQMEAAVPDDSFFVKILDRYKGKVIFIDFWATWCSPCLQGIQQIAPLKEELSDNKNVVFLYITNPSSPEKNYSITMPGIKGEHYRVSTDQYNILSKIFQITGIPHYAIINKQGEIVNRHFLWTETDQIKQQLAALENE